MASTIHLHELNSIERRRTIWALRDLEVAHLKRRIKKYSELDDSRVSSTLERINEDMGRSIIELSEIADALDTREQNG